MKISDLSTREIETLHLMWGGFSTEQIAATLCIKLVTVKNHKIGIFRKLRVIDSQQAVVWAFRQGLVRPEDIEPLQLALMPWKRES